MNIKHKQIFNIFCSLPPTLTHPLYAHLISLWFVLCASLLFACVFVFVVYIFAHSTCEHDSSPLFVYVPKCLCCCPSVRLVFSAATYIYVNFSIWSCGHCTRERSVYKHTHSSYMLLLRLHGCCGALAALFSIISKVRIHTHTDKIYIIYKITTRYSNFNIILRIPYGLRVERSWRGGKFSTADVRCI